MAAYVLTEKDAEELVTTVFASEGGDAVAVFTDSQSAERYLSEAGWSDSMTVATLDAIQFVEWLTRCYRDGIQLMAVDPDRGEQESGKQLTTMDIAAQLDHAGEHILLVARPDF